jgi:gamma-glutamyltranspeptidase/glutathione hydrolase/leukotriene-C4 hydrolase
MAPTIIEHSSGNFYLALGGSGGSRIFGAIAQTVLNLDRGMNVSGAVETPRVHDQLFPTLVSIESEFGDWELEGLKQRGHNISSKCLMHVSGREYSKMNLVTSI